MVAFRNERLIPSPGRNPVRRLLSTEGNRVICKGCRRATPRNGEGIDGGGRLCASGPLREAEEGELDAWGQFEVSPPVQMVTQNKDVVDTRWALTWEGIKSKETEKARLAAKGYQDPDLPEAARKLRHV